jgi:hypothetical protein
MAKNSGFDFKEFEKYLKKFDEIPKDLELFLEDFLLDIGQRVIERVKPRTPVDTGTLKNSWKISNISVGKTELSVEIFNPMEYASYVEYGAPNRNGTWRNGKFMLTVSIDEIRQQLPKRFEKEFNQYLKNKGIE